MIKDGLDGLSGSGSVAGGVACGPPESGHQANLLRRCTYWLEESLDKGRWPFLADQFRDDFRALLTEALSAPERKVG